MSDGVLVHEVRSSQLGVGSVVVVDGAARYLTDAHGRTCGYDDWSYTRQDAGGTARAGVMRIRAGSMVTVVARLVTGGVLVP